MYEAFFGLRTRPFVAAPQAARFFPAAVAETARQVLQRCIDRAEGPALLTGPAGTGKSLLLQVLAGQFRSTLEAACLTSGRLNSRRTLLQAILFELGLPYRDLEEGELRLALIDHVAQAAPPKRGLLLLVDEAHTLPIKLLEELRQITNLVRNGQPRVRLVLAGGPKLEEHFTSPKLEAFNQRLAARCYLAGFERAETLEFIRTQIRSSGGQPEQVFTESALAAVHQATSGIPRLINQVCDHALILAFAAGQKLLDAEGIEAAWADLQQLPSPQRASSHGNAPTNGDEGASGIIEFGGLSDETDEEPAAVPFRPLDQSDDEQASEMADADAPPAMQISRIEDQLSTIEDGMDTTDLNAAIDVVYPPAEHPFREPFEEEELVVDRYAALESDTFTGKPRVASREGNELARRLAEFGAVDTSAKARVNVNDRQPMQTADDSLRDAAPATISVAAIDRSTVEAFDDSDLIVIEDAPHEGEPARAQVPPVRRQEYRQLFAKLRRGER